MFCKKQNVVHGYLQSQFLPWITDAQQASLVCSCTQSLISSHLFGFTSISLLPFVDEMDHIGFVGAECVV